MEALDVSGFFCGGCPGKSSDSASPAAELFTWNGKCWGQPEHTQRLFMCCKLCSGRGQRYLDLKKSLCAGHLHRPRFSRFPPLTLQLFKEGRFHRTRENIWEVGDRHITADHWLPLLMEYKGFATSISCSKAWEAAWSQEGRICCSNFSCSHIPWCDTGIQLGQWLSSATDRSRDSTLPPL